MAQGSQYAIPWLKQNSKLLILEFDLSHFETNSLRSDCSSHLGDPDLRPWWDAFEELAEKNRRLLSSSSTPVEGSPKIHPIYFSCRKHFDYLRHAVGSLVCLGVPEIGTIWLYIDINDPLTPEQQAELSNLIPNDLEFRATEKLMSRSGLNVVYNEVAAYAEVCAQSQSEDLLVKIDSDFLFISSDIFTYVMGRRDFSILGKKVIPRNFRYKEPYIQGGCYFIQIEFLTNLLKGFSLDAFIQAFGRCPDPRSDLCPEDAMITYWFTLSGGLIQFQSFHLMPDYKVNLEDICASPSLENSALHFERHFKAKMADSYFRLLELKSACLERERRNHDLYMARTHTIRGSLKQLGSCLMQFFVPSKN